jgi:hypothetical protein
LEHVSNTALGKGLLQEAALGIDHFRVGAMKSPDRNLPGLW